MIKLADFINTEEQSEETPQEPEKVKVGEKEYTQEELSKLVGLGEIGLEAEEKYNVKIDKIWPNHQQTINEKQRLEKELDEARQQQTKAKVETGEELSPEEVAKQARQEAKKLGLISIEDVNEYIDRRIEAINLKEETEGIVGEAEEKYGIKTSEDAIYNHMVETGIRNPQKAFKDLYEEKLDAWKEKQLESLKKPGMATEDSQSAGAKQPKSDPITRDNFYARMDEIMERQS